MARARKLMVPEVAGDAGRPLAATGPLPADHPEVRPNRIGVVLMNLGTPDATDYWSMRRYLSEFLSDKRVIDYPSWLWQPLLQLVILSKRPAQQGPGLRHDLEQGAGREPAQDRDAQPGRRSWRTGWRQHSPLLMVDWAMRYGNPSVEGRARPDGGAGLPPRAADGPLPAICGAHHRHRLRQGVRRPQGDALAAGRAHHGPLSRPSGLYRGPGRAASRPIWPASTGSPILVVFSYHGMPKRLLLSGDPYHCHCQKTTRLVREQLGWPAEKVMVCFQSRFGSEEWLQPYLDKTMEELPGTRHQEDRRGLAGLRHRLPGDARGDPGREPRDLRACRRREVHLHPLPERQRRPHRACSRSWR